MQHLKQEIQTFVGWTGVPNPKDSFTTSSLRKVQALTFCLHCGSVSTQFPVNAKTGSLEGHRLILCVLRCWFMLVSKCSILKKDEKRKLALERVITPKN